jgi:formamidopyrimidine-DNA glycosylase
MPELPEVETLARDLQRLLRGAEFKAVTLYWSRSVAMPAPDELVQGLPGQRVLDVSRRGKFLQLSLSGPSYLLIHLRMSGHLQVEANTDPLSPYARVVFDLTDGRRLVFSDPRKFGRLYWLTQPDLVLGTLGPEPLADDLTLDTFRSLLATRKGALKPLLLNQALLAGLGNIYTDEALFRAGLHPLRKANSLTPDESERLYAAIRDVLQQAIDNRGTTLADARYRDAEGRPGHNRDNLRVYRHAGEPCACCGAPIERTVVGGRGTHFCPHCQK